MKQQISLNILSKKAVGASREYFVCKGELFLESDNVFQIIFCAGRYMAIWNKLWLHVL